MVSGDAIPMYVCLLGAFFAFGGIALKPCWFEFSTAIIGAGLNFDTCSSTVSALRFLMRFESTEKILVLLFFRTEVTFRRRMSAKQDRLVELVLLFSLVVLAGEYSIGGAPCCARVKYGKFTFDLIFVTSVAKNCLRSLTSVPKLPMKPGFEHQLSYFQNEHPLFTNVRSNEG